jgi:hypothetical protein
MAIFSVDWYGAVSRLYSSRGAARAKNSIDLKKALTDGV